MINPTVNAIEFTDDRAGDVLYELYKVDLHRLSQNYNFYEK